jgi:L-arabinose transport system substrate-binding protein
MAALAAVMSQSAIAENLKLGFLVKQPEEPWFQTEWKKNRVLNSQR